MVGCFISCSPNEHELVEEHYDDGRIKLRAAFVNRIQSGLTTLYHRNGMVKAEMPYKNGVKHGQIRQYYESGGTFKIAHAENGKLNGPNKEYDEQGRLIYFGNYRADYPIGVEVFHDYERKITRRNYYTNEGRPYYYEFRSEDNEKLASSLLPYFNKSNDTVRLNETYQVDILLAAPLKGEVYLVIESPNAELRGDTLKSITNKMFTYKVKPSKVGQNLVRGVFKHIKHENDTTTVDGASFVHRFFAVEE